MSEVISANISEEFVTPMTFAQKHLGEFIVKGTEIVPAYCPICHGGQNGDRDTFAMNLYTGAWNCKRGSCGKEGSFKDITDAYGELADPTVANGKNFMIQPMKKVMEYTLPSMELHPLTEEIISYFEKRRISQKTLEKYRVSSDKDGNIVFPFYRDGIFTYAKFRKPHKPAEGERKEFAVKGAEPILFGMDEVDLSRKRIVITEGMIDALSLAEVGIKNVLSVPSGSSDMRWVDTCWDWIEKFDEILIFGDADEPGQAMTKNLIKRFGEDRCLIIEEYPPRPNNTKEPCKDPNEILFFYGKDRLFEIANSPVEVPVKGIIRVAEIKRVDYTTMPRIITGIPKLDEITGGIFPGDVLIVTGEPGSGKSTIGGTLALNAIEQGYSVFAYSGELSQSRFLDWILLQAAGSDYIGLKMDGYRNKLIPYVAYPVEKRITDWMYDKLFLADNGEIMEEAQTDVLLRLCEQAYRRYNCSLFLIDNAMTAISDNIDERKAQIQLIKKLKRFAKKFDVSVMLVAHPRKKQANEPIRGDDIAGAKEFQNLADIAISIERPDIRIIKNRDSGVKTVIQCVYSPDSRRIYQSSMGDTYEYGWDKTGLKKPDMLANSIPEYWPMSSQQVPF